VSPSNRRIEGRTSFDRPTFARAAIMACRDDADVAKSVDAGDLKADSKSKT
jgi:hypothetical protein